MSLFKGVLAGIATGAEEVISADIEAGKLETKQLAKLRAERTIQRQDERNKTLRENIAKTQKLAAQLGPGGTSILRHYIEKGGLPYAEEATAQLLAYTKENDITPAQYAGISVEEGDLPTPQQLGEMATAPVKALAPVESSASGWSKMFGYGGPEAIQRKTDSYVASMSSAPTEVSPMSEKRKLPNLDRAIPTVKTFQEMSANLMKRQFNIVKKLKSNPNMNPAERKELEAQNTRMKQELTLIGEYKKLAAGDKLNLGEAYDQEVLANGTTEKAMKILGFIKLKEAAESTSTGLRTGTYIKGSSVQSMINIDDNQLFKDLGIRQGKITTPRPIFNADTGETVIHSPPKLQLMGLQGQIKIRKNYINMMKKGGTDTLGNAILNDLATEVQELERQVAGIVGATSDTNEEPAEPIQKNNTASGSNNMPTNKRQATDMYLTAIKSDPTQVAKFKKFIADGKFEQVIKSIQNSGRAKGITYTRDDALNIISILETINSPGGGPTG